MMLGEVAPGGIGAGLYGILIFAIITVFIGGLMVGRTPEYLGKKIRATEMKFAGAVLPDPAGGRADRRPALSIGTQQGQTPIFNPGPHGFTEILYAFTSQGNNNGSAFAGLPATRHLVQHRRRHRHAARPVRAS